MLPMGLRMALNWEPIMQTGVCLSNGIYKFFSSENIKSGWFTIVSTAVVLSEHLPRLKIRTPDLPALSPKVSFIRPPRWYLEIWQEREEMEENLGVCAGEVKIIE